MTRVRLSSLEHYFAPLREGESPSAAPTLIWDDVAQLETEIAPTSEQLEEIEDEDEPEYYDEAEW
jgi:hypothetical protein